MALSMLLTLFFIAVISAKYSSGVAYPTVSGMLTAVAPAAIAVSIALKRKS